MRVSITSVLREEQLALGLDALGAPLPVPDLRFYDVLLVSISGGKDSQAVLDVAVELARAAGVADRLVVVHADLGEMEWPGTKELCAEHAAHYGLRFEVVRREKDGRPQDILEHLEAKKRPMFPDAANRWCTSDHKRGPIWTLMTRLAREHREAGLTDRPVRILNIMGMRAQESSARALRPAFRHSGSRTCPCATCQALPEDERGSGASNTRRHVDDWLPIHAWTTAEVWARIRQAGTRPHWAYTKVGMPRLSCRFCVLASRSALVLSAKVNPELAERFAAVERRTGHRFRNDLSMAEIIAEARTSPAPARVEDWAA